MEGLSPVLGNWVGFANCRQESKAMGYLLWSQQPELVSNNKYRWDFIIEKLHLKSCILFVFIQRFEF